MSDFFDVFEDSSPIRFLETKAQMQRMGLSLAKVTNITDPDKHNRVKIKILSVESDKETLESDWCPVVMPLAGKSCGVFAMPSVGDLVLVAFLDGDPNCPYVIGGTWNEKSPAPYTVQEGKNVNFSVKTPGGSELLFYDEKNKEKITLSTPKKATLNIDDEKKTASFTDPEKKNTLTLNWEKGELEIKADKKITFTAGKASVVLDGSGKITIKADTSIEIKTADIKAEASNGFKAKGAQASIEASGKLTLKGATADLKGSAGVNIN